ncbi:hypothetical protein pA_gene0031 [Vibrio phage 13VT501A]|nr:hypothetical protein pA_gene0031 [Vibrio phage 13VT501A]
MDMKLTLSEGQIISVNGIYHTVENIEEVPFSDLGCGPVVDDVKVTLRSSVDGSLIIIKIDG